ncbi:MAG: hypothetical protein ACJAR8_000490 [Bacteroidia bacterium]|jgi:hypothetical protein|tara:strand:+ start:330 stop:440 length:111 start_codon:yes stop_codon:yes gene_type:complete
MIGNNELIEAGEAHLNLEKALQKTKKQAVTRKQKKE